MKLAVIGFGPGGIAAATAAKTFDRSVEVCIYTSESLDAHRKPGASLALADPDTKGLVINNWTVDTLTKKGIEVVRGSYVTNIDAESKTLEVRLPDNSLTTTKYDKLILAVGGVPSEPAVEGANLDGVFTIQDMSDTAAIGKRLSSIKSVVVVGAGFSGLEVAERMLDLGKEVHLIVRSRLMRRLLEPEMSAELKSRLPSTLVMHEGESPVRVTGTARVQGIELQTASVPAQAVLFMTGVKPNLELASSMGLETGDLGGIRVSNLMETSHKDIYAVGDCVEMFDRYAKKPVLMPIASVAARAGRQAGVAAVGGSRAYEDISIRFQYDRLFNTDVVCVGHSTTTALAVDIQSRVHYLEDAQEFTKVALVTTEDGILIGGQVIAPRMGARIGYQIHQRIESGARLDDTPLLEPLHKRMKDLLEARLGPIR
jgi:NAD(P)H-nitrite reductase large subunit